MNCNPTPYDPRTSPYSRGTSAYSPKASPFSGIASPFLPILGIFDDGCYPAILLYPEDHHAVTFDDGVTIKL